jgi:hypothetical protein
MEIKMTNRQLVACYNAIDNVGKLENLEFDSELIVQDLALNKKAIEAQYIGLTVYDRQSADYKKFQREVQKVRSEKDQNKIRDEINKMQIKYAAAIEKEFDRVDSIEEMMNKIVTVKNVCLIPRKNSEGKLTVSGRKGPELKFIIDIEPFFEPETEDSATPAKKK